jgi:FkbM family methyltransferase
MFETCDDVAEAIGAIGAIAAESSQPFFFIQVGANDGTTDDPLHTAVQTRSWQGLAIEPLPHLFQRLIETYAKSPHVTCLRIAISDRPGYRDMYYVQPRPSDPYWVDQLGSFSRDVVMSHAGAVADLSQRVLVQPVEVRSLLQLVIQHQISRIDLLHVDAEGHDDVVVSSIDFEAAWAPKFILFEHDHLAERRSNLELLLARKGYKLHHFEYDTLAWRETP